MRTQQQGPFNAWGRERFWPQTFFWQSDWGPWTAPYSPGSNIPGWKGPSPGYVAAGAVALDTLRPITIRNSRIEQYPLDSAKLERAGLGPSDVIAVDLDGGSSNFHVYQNLVFGSTVKVGSLGDLTNITNNIFVQDETGLGVHYWLLMEENQNRVERNILYWPNQTANKICAHLGGTDAQGPAFADRNVYFGKCDHLWSFPRRFRLSLTLTRRAVAAALKQEQCRFLTYPEGDDRSKWLPAWQNRTGLDQHSLWGGSDPCQFVAPEAEDYRLRPGSPAAALGIQNFTVGPRSSVMQWAKTDDPALPAGDGGLYGSWEKDSLGLPVYRYMFDQIADEAANYTPSAATPWSRVHWSELPLASDITVKASNEHVFQIGNDRLVVISNNYGAVRVRQDEGGCKFLNDASAAYPHDVPQSGGDVTQFGGGFGYLLEDTGRPLLTTYFTGAQQRAGTLRGSTSRSFGIGFAKTATVTPTLSVDHTCAVPYGDDPVVLIEVQVANHGAVEKTVHWAEVWGSLLVHLDEATFRTQGRREFSATHYRSALANVTGGVSHSRQWLGLSDSEQEYLNAALKGSPALGLKRATMWDEQPPTPFLVALGTDTIRTATDARAFFGSGGPRQPTGDLVFDASVAERDAALIVSTELALGPRESKTLRLVWGYTKQGEEHARDPLVEKYRAYMLSSSSTLAEKVAESWKPHLASIEMPSTPWLSQEMAWHSYYVQSGVSYDSLYN